MCNDFIFYDYKNLGNSEELNQVRKCTNNKFHEKIPVNRISVSLSLIDDVNLEIRDNDIENVIEIIHDLRENIL